MPDYNARAKIGEYWSTIGAAWNVKDGGISLRLNTIPVGGEWDGSVLLLPPKEDAADNDGKDRAAGEKKE
jgi:hypothetical protein